MYERVAYHIPVCHHHSGLFFLNRFCAACNGYRMEETFSFYTHIELSENWLALNHSVDELFENFTGVDELLVVCLHTSVLEIPNACDTTAERRRIYDRVVVNDQEKISLCTGFPNPVVSKNNLGLAVIMKNQFCLQNTSAPGHCYDGKVRPYTKDADTSNETVVVWVNKFGDAVVSPPNSGYDDTEINIGGTSWVHSPATIPLALFFFVFRYIYLITDAHNVLACVATAMSFASTCLCNANKIVYENALKSSVCEDTSQNSCESREMSCLTFRCPCLVT